MGRQYFILALDGGGIRGALTASLLSQLEGLSSFLPGVDMFAGTSTGGIQALALASEKTPSQVLDLYRRRGQDIFKSRGWIDKVSAADELLRSDYSDENLYRVMVDELGPGVLCDLHKHVLIPTVKLRRSYQDGTPDRWAPKFYHNFIGSEDANVKIADLATWTSCAPTFFPSRNGHIDGGVAANSPGMAAKAKAIKSGIPAEDIHILAVGTGVMPTYFDPPNDWGLLAWGPKILQVFMDSAASTTHYQLLQELGEKYHRIDVYLDANIALDDVGAIPKLEQLGVNHDLSKTVEWLYSRGLSG